MATVRKGIFASATFWVSPAAPGCARSLERRFVVANYQHSFRAPALEELYNNGPHPGILVFDIGNPNLKAEQGDGIDVSLRHNSERLRLESSVYYYNFSNFVFTSFTGVTDPGSHLPIVDYAQGRSRYLGAEASVEARLVPKRVAEWKDRLCARRSN